MTGGGGPSAAEVAASFPARLLGAIKNCKSSRSTLKQRRKKERKRQKFSEREISFLFSPIGLL